MRFSRDTAVKRRARKKLKTFSQWEWHVSFAWFPVWSEADKAWIWWENVERRRESFGYHISDKKWVYRGIKNEFVSGPHDLY